jgi:hypothetical protein
MLRLYRRFLYYSFSFAIGVGGFLFALFGNVMTTIGALTPKRPNDDGIDLLVLTHGTEQFSIDNCLAAHHSHSSHSSHSSHTSGASVQSHSSHYSATAPVEPEPRPSSPPVSDRVSSAPVVPVLEPERTGAETENTLSVSNSTAGLELEYNRLRTVQRRALESATSRAGSLFVSPLVLLRAQVFSVATKETAFLSELNAALDAVIDRRSFTAAKPEQGIPFYAEKKKFYDIKVEWDAYLEKATQTIRERDKNACSDLLSRALQVGNTNLAKRISETLILKRSSE